MNCKKYLKRLYDELVDGGYAHIDKVNWIAMNASGEILVCTSKPKFIISELDDGFDHSAWMVSYSGDVDDWYDVIDTIIDPSQYNAAECIYYCKGENIDIGESQQYNINGDINIVVLRNKQGYYIDTYSVNTNKLIATETIREKDYKED